ncbi:CrcB protein [Nocardia bhagyanarayanae]|uniref:Fluoride-specific ion channel FluC n=2 Tax=Nocardia bhagyanarayanae TaxID=1215925 RepID=A0A543FB76_9NOCA|nr:CrcB protein [Nocardia bhagyanarayanae]
MGSQARTPAVEPAVLAVISVGGGIGAVMRYLVGLRWPSQPNQVPWSTFAINVVGCFSIGILMVLITEVWVAHRLLRPFLGVGLLGGFTTFSTYSLEIRRLLESGAAIEALGYLGGTVAASLVAVWLGMGVARLSAGTTRPRRRGGRQ